MPGAEFVGFVLTYVTGIDRVMVVAMGATDIAR
jgi:hypothetical protein